MAEFIQIWTTMAESSTPTHRKNRLKLTELNPHLICILCGGYYIDATTIVECLHTFCKTCIVGYLGMSKHCPACDTLVHKTKPLLRLRPDHTMQDLVYKLVPGLFKDEMKKRRNFYKEEIESGKVDDRPSSDARERIIYSLDEQISLALELSTDGRPPFNPANRTGKQKHGPKDRRYLQCPAAFTIGHLKKFIRMKFNLCDRYQIDLFHTDEALRDTYSLMDVAYIYSWRRKGPLRLYYTVFTNPAKRLKTETVTDVNRIIIQEMVNDIIDKTKENNTAIVKDSDIPNTKANDNEIDIEMKLPNNNNNKETSDLQLKSQTETSTAPRTITSVNEVAGETKEELETCAGEVAEDKIKETKSVNEPESESVETNINTKEISSTNPPEKVTESTSDGDDSGNFSLEESFDNSISDVNKTESDDTVNSENSNTENMVDDSDGIDSNNSKSKENDEKSNSEEKESEIHDDVFTEEKGKITETITEEVHTSTSESNNQLEKNSETEKLVTDDAKKLEIHDNDKQVEAAKHCIVSETAESSTSTSDLDTCKDSVSSSLSKTNSKVYGKDDLVSEPIVSSTQNTQGCQTDVDDNEKSKPDELSSKEDDTPSSNFDNLKLTIDVSCETENFEVARQASKESVSVSTDTEELTRETPSKRKSVDSSTITDIPYKSARKNSTDSGTSTAFQEKVNKPVSPRRLSPNPAIMEAQPLSPTRIALKLASPTSPSKRPSQSPSRSDLTSSTFLSKFESFVNELPDTSQDYEPPYTNPGQPSIAAISSLKIQDESNINEVKPDSSPKKPVQITVKRPRGRPPKNKTVDSFLVTKHKSHKSRSTSPKRKRSYEKQKSESYVHSYKSSESVALSKSSDSKNLKQDSGKSNTQPTSQAHEKKIPKHFVLFSNGQYTLATENNISKFKQSSPLSPTRTVSDTVLSSYGDKDKYSKSAKSNSHSWSGKYVHKSDNKSSKRSKSFSQDSHQPVLKPLKITISEPAASISKSNEQTSASELKDTKVKTTEVLTSVDVTKTQSNTLPSITVPSVSFSHSKEVTATSDSKTNKTPEYRHQSPFFASISGAKLTSPHRPSTHLNIPNLNSHFGGAHYLYSQNSYRYTNDRLGSPSFRSLPGLGIPETKSLGISALTAKTTKEIASSHSAIVSPFLSPLSIPSMMHLPATQSLHLPNFNTSPKGYSPDSTKSPLHMKPDSHNGFSAPVNSSMSSIKTVPKPSSVRKMKEKSIDNVISAITEMRNKKEGSTSEQLTGMDLTTKNRNSPLPCDKRNVTLETKAKDKIVDKYAFTDEDDIPSKRPSLHLKTDHRKSISDPKESV